MKHTDINNSFEHLPVLKEVEVAVAGGGVAGAAAAIASARGGAKTLLIEQSGCLGGMATLGLVAPIAAVGTVDSHRSFGGILWEVLNDVSDASQKYSKSTQMHHSSLHILKHILLGKVVESGSDLSFHTFIVDVLKKDNKINALVVATKSGLALIKAQVFIDTTGDGDVMYLSGAQTVLGSEEGVLGTIKSDGGLSGDNNTEEISSNDYTGKLQPVSVMFTMAQVDVELGCQYMNKKLTYDDLNITKEEFKQWEFYGTCGFEGRDDDLVPMPQGRVWLCQMTHKGEAIINMSRVIDINGADAISLSEGEIKAQRQVFALVDFLQKFIPGFEHAYFMESSATLGVRETRRLVGDYVLTGRDAVACTPFYDVISHGSYIIDIHDPCGKRMAIGGRVKGDFYDIPYRSLITSKVPNLITAGRCISADHVAHSSTRIQGTAMLTGQAAGTAAAMAVKDDVSLGEVDVAALQAKLIADGMMLEPPLNEFELQHTQAAI